MYCHAAYTSQWPNEKDTIPPLSQPFFPQEHCHDAEITSCVTGNL